MTSKSGLITLPNTIMNTLMTPQRAAASKTWPCLEMQPWKKKTFQKYCIPIHHSNLPSFPFPLQFNKLVSEMTGIYAAGKVCPFDKQNCDLPTEGLTLEPGISEVMDNPADHTWEELEYFWKNWRDASGKQMKTKFLRYIDLSNEAAKANSKS